MMKTTGKIPSILQPDTEEISPEMLAVIDRTKREIEAIFQRVSPVRVRSTPRST